MAYTTRFSTAKTGAKAFNGRKGRLALVPGLHIWLPARTIVDDSDALSLVAAAFTAAPAPRVRCLKLDIKAQAAASEDAADLTRRAILSSSVALGAAAVLPMSVPQPAAANTVLSGDWEQVRIHADRLVASVSQFPEPGDPPPQYCVYGQ